MRILVINSGSSSIKYQLINTDDTHVLAKGLVERIGETDGVVSHSFATGNGFDTESEERPVADHELGFRAIIDALSERGALDDLGGVGHRVVHGGERFGEPTIIDDDVVATIRDLTPLAPLHNPPNARGIEVARTLRPDVPHVAVFDTSFHRSMPARAYRYAIPTEHYEQHGVRRYGFHGTSHQYVARMACDHLSLDPAVANLVTAHLGNGVSMTAVAGGRSIDTSMGLSPLEGLVMGTRSGDIDPTIIFHLGRATDMTPDDIETMLNKRSGLKGLSGDNDVRVITERADAGEPDAELALEVFCYRLRKYIGAYSAALGGVDVLVFTAGIGEHSAAVRQRTCTDLEHLGIVLDPERNAEAGDGITVISREASPVTVLVVPTNEEREIAEQTQAAIAAHRSDLPVSS